MVALFCEEIYQCTVAGQEIKIELTMSISVEKGYFTWLQHYDSINKIPLQPMEIIIVIWNMFYVGRQICHLAHSTEIFW